MIAAALVQHNILKWFLMVSKSVFESFLITVLRSLFEINFKGINFKAENQFYNLSKETEAPHIQGHPKDRDHH